MNTALIFATTTSGTPSGSAPVANFSISDTQPLVGQIIYFTDMSTNTPTSWQWTVNGSIFSTQQNPVYYCNAVGYLTFQLTATNQFGSASTSQQIFVAPNV